MAEVVCVTVLVAVLVTVDAGPVTVWVKMLVAVWVLITVDAGPVTVWVEVTVAEGRMFVTVWLTIVGVAVVTVWVTV